MTAREELQKLIESHKEYYQKTASLLEKLTDEELRRVRLFHEAHIGLIVSEIVRRIYAGEQKWYK